jgi:hypothetical protein
MPTSFSVELEVHYEGMLSDGTYFYGTVKVDYAPDQYPGEPDSGCDFAILSAVDDDRGEIDISLLDRKAVLTDAEGEASDWHKARDAEYDEPDDQ